jgi:hypothetical protein
MPPPVRNPQLVLEAIHAASKRFPDLRIGQLICVAMRNNGRDFDLFNVEDENLAELLNAVLNRPLKLT